MYNNFKENKINKKTNYCNLSTKRFTNNTNVTILIYIRTSMYIF